MVFVFQDSKHVLPIKRRRRYYYESTISCTETVSPSQESSKNGLAANYRTVNLFPLAFILYSFMEIECISLKEQLKALVVIYMKSCEVSLHTDGRESVKMIVGSSRQFPAIPTLLTRIQQVECRAARWSDGKFCSVSTESCFFWPSSPTGHRHPGCCSAAVHSG